MSQTMRAISQDSLGGPEVLKPIELPKPEPGPVEVLVRVHATSVNPTDWKIRQVGAWLGEPPFVLGWDVSGTVEAVGVGVAVHKPGDEVFGMLRYPGGHGANAEYVTAPARTFVPRPAGLDHAQAAAIPLAGLTAYQALVDIARVQQGQRVLIHAAAGGVGHFAVQIAKALGAYVIGTASAAKHEFVTGLGADEVVDYRTEDFTEVVKDVDAVLDLIGGDYGDRSVRTIKRGGVLVNLVLSRDEVDLAEADERGVRVEEMLVEPDHQALSALADLASSGHLVPRIAATVPLEDLAKAHELSASNRTAGKIVVTV